MQYGEIFDEEKDKFINSKSSIWDYFAVWQADYMTYQAEDKSREYFTTKNNINYFFLKKNFFVLSDLSG